MPDPALTIFGGAVAFAMRDTLTRLLGPAADVVGNHLAALTDAQIANLRKIFEKALHKSHPDDDGPTSPRVLKSIIDDGAFSDDEIVADYYSGMAASSRTSGDDTGAYYASMVRSLAAEQLRAHWILYTFLFSHYRGQADINMYDRESRKSATVLVPWKSFLYLFDILSDNKNFSFHNSEDKCTLFLIRRRLNHLTPSMRPLNIIYKER